MERVGKDSKKKRAGGGGGETTESEKERARGKRTGGREGEKATGIDRKTQ